MHLVLQLEAHNRNATGGHITNQACIQAAVELGFDYWPSEGGLNANFHMELNFLSTNGNALSRKGSPDGYSSKTILGLPRC